MLSNFGEPKAPLYCFFEIGFCVASCLYIYLYIYRLYTVSALIFARFVFRGLAIFAFLNSRLLGTVVLKYSQVKYSQIYRVSPYTIIVYGSCRSAKLAGLIVGFV